MSAGEGNVEKVKNRKKKKRHLKIMLEMSKGRVGDCDVGGGLV